LRGPSSAWGQVGWTIKNRLSLYYKFAACQGTKRRRYESRTGAHWPGGWTAQGELSKL